MASDSSSTARTAFTASESCTRTSYSYHTIALNLWRPVEEPAQSRYRPKISNGAFPKAVEVPSRR